MSGNLSISSKFDTSGVSSNCRTERVAAVIE